MRRWELVERTGSKPFYLIVLRNTRTSAPLSAVLIVTVPWTLYPTLIWILRLALQILHPLHMRQIPSYQLTQSRRLRPQILMHVRRGLLHHKPWIIYRFSGVCCLARYTSCNLKHALDENRGDPSDGLWSMYISEAEKQDTEVTESWNGDTGGILVFVGPAPSCLCSPSKPTY